MYYSSSLYQWWPPWHLYTTRPNVLLISSDISVILWWCTWLRKFSGSRKFFSESFLLLRNVMLYKMKMWKWNLLAMCGRPCLSSQPQWDWGSDLWVWGQPGLYGRALSQNHHHHNNNNDNKTKSNSNKERNKGKGMYVINMESKTRSASIFLRLSFRSAFWTCEAAKWIHLFRWLRIIGCIYKLQAQMNLGIIPECYHFFLSKLLYFAFSTGFNYQKLCKP